MRNRKKASHPRPRLRLPQVVAAAGDGGDSDSGDENRDSKLEWRTFTTSFHKEPRPELIERFEHISGIAMDAQRALYSVMEEVYALALKTVLLVSRIT